MPSAVDALPCGSMSSTRTRRPDIASAAARFTVVVVLPTPPFWLATVRTRVCSGTGSRWPCSTRRRRASCATSWASGVSSSGVGIALASLVGQIHPHGACATAARMRPLRRAHSRLRSVGRLLGRRSARAGCGGAALGRCFTGNIGPARSNWQPSEEARTPAASRCDAATTDGPVRPAKSGGRRARSPSSARWSRWASTRLGSGFSVPYRDDGARTWVALDSPPVRVD